MKLSDILNQPISIGNNDQLTLKQVVESSFTRANNLETGLKQAEAFFKNLDSIIASTTATPEAAPANKKPSKPKGKYHGWEADPEAARGLVILESINELYNLYDCPIQLILIISDISEKSTFDPDIWQMFGKTNEHKAKILPLLDALCAGGVIHHNKNGYFPDISQNPSYKTEAPADEKPAGEKPSGKSADEEPAVKAEEPDPIREFFDEIGLCTKIGSIDALDELRDITKGSSVLPLAAGIGGAIFGLYMASKTDKGS